MVMAYFQMARLEKVIYLRATVLQAGNASKQSAINYASETLRAVLGTVALTNCSYY